MYATTKRNFRFLQQMAAVGQRLCFQRVFTPAACSPILFTLVKWLLVIRTAFPHHERRLKRSVMAMPKDVPRRQASMNKASERMAIQQWLQQAKEGQPPQQPPQYGVQPGHARVSSNQPAAQVRHNLCCFSWIRLTTMCCRCHLLQPSSSCSGSVSASIS